VCVFASPFFFLGQGRPRDGAWDTCATNETKRRISPFCVAAVSVCLFESTPFSSVSVEPTHSVYLHLLFSILGPGRPRDGAWDA